MLNGDGKIKRKKKVSLIQIDVSIIYLVFINSIKKYLDIVSFT